VWQRQQRQRQWQAAAQVRGARASAAAAAAAVCVCAPEPILSFTLPITPPTFSRAQPASPRASCSSACAGEIPTEQAALELVVLSGGHRLRRRPAAAAAAAAASAAAAAAATFWLSAVLAAPRHPPRCSSLTCWTPKALVARRPSSRSCSSLMFAPALRWWRRALCAGVVCLGLLDGCRCFCTGLQEGKNRAVSCIGREERTSGEQPRSCPQPRLHLGTFGNK
jgi:hypothetical protein